MSDEELLIPNEEYLKSGIQIGTKFKTKHMANFIYKTRPDGLSVLNITEIDKRIRVTANLLAQFAPEEILIVCRRENGWKPVKRFGELTGCNYFAGRYPPGLLTNPDLKQFKEVKLMLVSDNWPDRNAVNDALKMGVPVIALCDTNNQTNNIDLVLPCNNKGRRASASCSGSCANSTWSSANSSRREDSTTPSRSSPTNKRPENTRPREQAQTGLTNPFPILFRNSFYVSIRILTPARSTRSHHHSIRFSRIAHGTFQYLASNPRTITSILTRTTKPKEKSTHTRTAKERSRTITNAKPQDSYFQADASAPRPAPQDAKGCAKP
ncbi:MAG: 30S ribosomal protein S2 [Nitrosarchaeum sp.]|nr:30S ribosomal protein S2 [Nitrosarchaeum sp.]